MIKMLKSSRNKNDKNQVYVIVESPIKFLIVKEFLPTDIKIIWLSPVNLNFMFQKGVKNTRLLKYLSKENIIFWNGEWEWQRTLITKINPSNRIYFIENANMPDVIQFSNIGINYKALPKSNISKSPDIDRFGFLQKYQTGFHFKPPLTAKLIEALNSQFYRALGIHKRFRRKNYWYQLPRKPENIIESHQKPRNSVYCVLQVWDDTQLDKSNGRNREIINCALDLGAQMGLKVVFRIHPKCNCLDFYADLLVGQIVHFGPLQDALHESNIVTGYNSSVLIQSLLTGCRTVFFGDFLSPVCDKYKGKVVQFDEMSDVLGSYFNVVIHDKEKISKLFQKR